MNKFPYFRHQFQEIPKIDIIYDFVLEF
eukprot:Gb_13466 [translate_table: standard]